MKIGYAGLDLPEGKVRFDDDDLAALAEKDQPKKLVPYFAELEHDQLEDCAVIAVAAENLLDVLIVDVDKVDVRLSRVTDPKERDVLARAETWLEGGSPLCDGAWSAEDVAVLRALGLVSLKPVLQVDAPVGPNELVQRSLAAAELMFFYTSGPRETHAWIAPAGATMIDCAGRIHTDLARGFIRGEVAAVDAYLGCHNMAECRTRGLVRLLDRDEIVPPRSVVEIRFNV